MNKIYTAFFGAALVLSASCSKDFLKSYNERIIGTWEITDVDRHSIGASTSHLPFRNGLLKFMDDGALEYIQPDGTVFQGQWDIDKVYDDESDAVRSLQISVVDYATKEMRSEYYDRISFRSGDHIRAEIYSGFHTYVTHLKR